MPVMFERSVLDRIPGVVAVWADASTDGNRGALGAPAGIRGEWRGGVPRGASRG